VCRSTKQFAPDNQRFEHLAFLNLAQNVCFVVALLSECTAPHPTFPGTASFRHPSFRKCNSSFASVSDATAQLSLSTVFYTHAPGPSILHPLSLCCCSQCYWRWERQLLTSPQCGSTGGPSVSNTIRPACGLIALKYIMILRRSAFTPRTFLQKLAEQQGELVSEKAFTQISNYQSSSK